ncbi:MAG: serine/threonine protein kinase [Myxococcales bacterium]|nr:serine/threonine protein kinase [Myxococcales bacterium]
MKRRPPDDRDTLVEAKKTRLGVGPGAPELEDEVPLVGKVVGGYLVEEEIGAGAMGTVYRASHLDTNRKVALKSLHAHHLSEATTVERFRREARLASRLGHPHIGGVIELVQAEDGRYLIALELVEGEPLSSIMTMPLAPERVMLITGQLLRGLEHAHAMGLIHRDLKPDNVLVEWRNGRDHARIVDFGIAIVRDGSEDSIERLTAKGQIVGTPIYMAPEHARGDAIDHRADLYSLGVMVYEMISGVVPFHGRPLDVLTAKLKRDPPQFADRVPDLIVEPILERFCRKLMARERSQRFDNARHALHVLKLLETEPAAAGAALGIMDVEKALSIVSLPGRPDKPE